MNKHLNLILVTLLIASALATALMSSVVKRQDIEIQRLQHLNVIREVLKPEVYQIVDIENKIRQLSKNIPDEDAVELAISIYKYANKYKLDSNLLIGIGMEESRFRKYAVSSANCHGIFQINMSVHDVDVDRIYDIDYNTKWGTMILIDKLRRYNNNMTLALNGYNAWASYRNPYAYDVRAWIKKIKT